MTGLRALAGGDAEGQDKDHRDGTAKPPPPKRPRYEVNLDAAITHLPQRKRRAPELYTDQPSQWVRKPKPVIPVQAEVPATGRNSGGRKGPPEVARSGSVQLHQEPPIPQTKVLAAGRKRGSAKALKQPVGGTAVQDLEDEEPKGGRRGRGRPQLPVADPEEVEVEMQNPPGKKPAKAQKVRPALVEADREVIHSRGTSVEEGDFNEGRAVEGGAMPKKPQAQERPPAKVAPDVRPASAKVSGEGVRGSKAELGTRQSAPVGRGVGRPRGKLPRSASVEVGEQLGRRPGKGASALQLAPIEDEMEGREKGAMRVPCNKRKLQVRTWSLCRFGFLPCYVSYL